MKASKGLLLFATVATLSGCGLFGQLDETPESSDISSSSQIDSESVVSESSVAESSSESSAETSESEAEPSPEEPEEVENALTAEEVLAQVETDLGTEIDAQLPTDLPITEGMYLTATTAETENGYEVIFYESQAQIPVNDMALVSQNTDAAVIGRVTVTEYATQEESDAAIAFTDYSQVGGNEVDLGYDITGYQDSATGHTYTSWNEGRWDLATVATTEDSETGVAAAQEAVVFLEENLLPAPNQYGKVQLDTVNPENNRVAWQEGTRVIALDQVIDPIQILLLATYFE